MVSILSILQKRPGKYNDIEQNRWRRFKLSIHAILKKMLHPARHSN